MEQLTKELVEASLIPEITKQGFSELVEAIKNIKISKVTIGVDYVDLTKVAELLKSLEEKKEAEDKPDKDRIKARKEGYDIYTKPLKEALEEAEPDFFKTNREIKLFERTELEKINKAAAIRQRHIDFVNEIIQLVVIAPDNKELARIQSLVGSEK